MSVAVAGSIATDHLMKFDGKFSDSLVVDQLDKLAVSFLVDDLEIRRGGCAANIAYGLAALGHRPILVGAVGGDFDEYRTWLTEHGVDCDHVRVSDKLHTARCTITTDEAHAQIVTFYAGAMAEAREIDLAAIRRAEPGIDLVLVGPDDPEGMLRHTATCRSEGIPFAADPSQQLAFADGEVIRDLIDGATYLFSNDYEAALTEKKTGWSAGEILERVGTRVVTHGAEGAEIQALGKDPVMVPAVAGIDAVDPTGVGDSFRAGFLAAVEAGLDHRHAAEVGCTLAASVVETTGTQEYALDRVSFLARFRGAYGETAAAEVDAMLPTN